MYTRELYSMGPGVINHARPCIIVCWKWPYFTHIVARSFFFSRNSTMAKLTVPHSNFFDIFFCRRFFCSSFLSYPPSHTRQLHWNSQSVQYKMPLFLRKFLQHFHLKKNLTPLQSAQWKKWTITRTILRWIAMPLDKILFRCSAKLFS